MEYDTPDAPPYEEKHGVSKFFDTGGYFWEAGFAGAVQRMVAKFESKKKRAGGICCSAPRLAACARSSVC